MVYGCMARNGKKYFLRQHERQHQTPGMVLFVSLSPFAGGWKFLTPLLPPPGPEDKRETGFIRKFGKNDMFQGLGDMTYHFERRICKHATSTHETNEC